MMKFCLLNTLNGAGIAALSASEWAGLKYGEPFWCWSTAPKDGASTEVYDTRQQAINAAQDSMDGLEERETFYISCYDEDANGDLMLLSEEEVELDAHWLEEAEALNAMGYSWESSVREARA